MRGENVAPSMEMHMKQSEKASKRLDYEEAKTKILAERDWLVNFLIKKTGNQADAEDLAQDVIMRALKYLANYDGTVNIRPWIARIATNAFINEYRSSNAREKGNNALAATVSEVDMAYLEDPLLQDRITEAVASLSDEFRAPFLLYQDGKSYKQIADELSIPLGTVMSRLFRAHKKLRELLQPVKDELEGRDPKDDEGL